MLNHFGHASDAIVPEHILVRIGIQGDQGRMPGNEKPT